MSVIVPSHISEDSSLLPDHVGLGAWTLCAEFVEQIVSEARAAIERDNPGEPISEVDWDSIWRAGDGAPSNESAIGRVIRAASEAAMGIGVASRDVIRPSTSSVRVNDPLDPRSTLNQLPAAGQGSVAQVETPVALVEPATSTDSLAAPREADATTAEPLTTPVERAGPPVALASSVAQPIATPVESVVAPVAPERTAAEPMTVSVPATTPSEPVAAPEIQTTPAGESVSLKGKQDAAAERATRHRAGWITVFTWMRNAGAIIILLVVWQLWGTAIAQHQSQDQLKAQFHAALRNHHPPVAVAPGALIPAGTRFSPPADGSALARLEIPAIGADQYVVEGTTEDDLSKGPGHYVGTALPGQAGNVAIAGHRTTHGAPFNGLGHLVKGDKIVLTTSWGERLTYVVSGTPQAVSPGDVGVLNYFGDNRITLTTCNPEYSSSQRLVAVGQLNRRVKTPPPAHVSYHIVDPATASWDWSLLPLVGIEICLLLLLALSYQRFDSWFGRGSKWLILAPLWAAGLYILFGTLTTFLPSSY